MRNADSGLSPALVETVSELILEVFRLNGSLLESGDALVADIGLTSARWQVLGAISLSPAPLPVAHLARNMGLSRQSVQRLANELEKDGLIRYAPNPHHERAKLVLLTERGAAAFKEAMARQGPWVMELVAGIDAEDIQAARSLLREIRMRLGRAGGRKGGRSGL
jgi:DNA-binding MarR family transcriptional regulator